MGDRGDGEHRGWGQRGCGDVRMWDSEDGYTGDEGMGVCLFCFLYHFPVPLLVDPLQEKTCSITELVSAFYSILQHQPKF